jgi:16S rRNA (uracil1498-N3)-methyltransferase
MPSAGSEAARLPRFHCETALALGQPIALPPSAARHVQVLRLQPGAWITLFDGRGGEYRAIIEQMARTGVRVRIESHDAVEREAHRAIHLAMGMPANERMDWLVEKATELGAASFQPLLTQRSVVRLTGERAQRKQAHWQAVAAAACEQCGRNRVPVVHPPVELGSWLQTLGSPTSASGGAPGLRCVLSLDPAADPAPQSLARAPSLTLLSGPEGGLTRDEEAAAKAAGFLPVTLGPRVLRAETAPLLALGRWAEESGTGRADHPVHGRAPE